MKNLVAEHIEAVKTIKKAIQQSRYYAARLLPAHLENRSLTMNNLTVDETAAFLPVIDGVQKILAEEPGL